MTSPSDHDQRAPSPASIGGTESNRSELTTPLLMGEPDAARMLSISRRKLFDLRKHGVMRARLIDGRVLSSVREFERWVDAGCPLPTADGEGVARTAHDDTPEAVQARWELRQTFSPFDRERYHAEMDAAERRHGRRPDTGPATGDKESGSRHPGRARMTMRRRCRDDRDALCLRDDRRLRPPRQARQAGRAAIGLQERLTDRSIPDRSDWRRHRQAPRVHR